VIDEVAYFRERGSGAARGAAAEVASFYGDMLEMLRDRTTRGYQKVRQVKGSKQRPKMGGVFT
jgi:hypothetical protein